MCFVYNNRWMRLVSFILKTKKRSWKVFWKYMMDTVMNVDGNTFSDNFLLLEQSLAKQLAGLDYSSTNVTHVYNPLIYAEEMHRRFLIKHQNRPKPILFLGMNPGPWGMAQSGVPFGEVQIVREWMGLLSLNDQDISALVQKPCQEHPKRPVEGLRCKRREVSGERLWTCFREYFGSIDNFFQHCAIYNHCPLLFLSQSGKNLTPADMKAAQRNVILKLCDQTLIQVLEMLQTKLVVGIGKYAEQRARSVILSEGLNIQVAYLNHPSPASAQANKGWNELAKKQLNSISLEKFFLQESDRCKRFQ